MVMVLWIGLYVMEEVVMVLEKVMGHGLEELVIVFMLQCMKDVVMDDAYGGETWTGGDETWRIRWIGVMND